MIRCIVGNMEIAVYTSGNITIGELYDKISACLGKSINDFVCIYRRMVAIRSMTLTVNNVPEDEHILFVRKHLCEPQRADRIALHNTDLTIMRAVKTRRSERKLMDNLFNHWRYTLTMQEPPKAIIPTNTEMGTEPLPKYW